MDAANARALCTIMRHIGSFASEAQARFFTDFLLSRDIRSHLESEADRSWAIWIRDEDQI